MKKALLFLILCVFAACILTSCNTVEITIDIPVEGATPTPPVSAETKIQSELTPTPSDTEDLPVGIIIPDTMSSAYDGVKITAKNSFVYDIEEGLKYFKGDLTAPIYPASVTKLYTAKVALDYLEPKTVITAGDELDLRMPDSSVAYISKGQKLTVEMLVEAMMLPSGNDAAYVLAAAAGRKIRHESDCSPQDAVKTFMMAVNARAYIDGMYHTHFTTPDGYHADDHYTCMQDLIIIGKLALENETIMKYTGLHSDTVHFVSGQSITWKNNNPFVNPASANYRKNVIGLKTGFTSKAGSCIITAQKIGDSIVLVGVFGASSSYVRNTETATLLDIAAKYQK